MRATLKSASQKFLKNHISTVGYSFIAMVSIILIYRTYTIGTGGDFQYYINNGKLISDGINPYGGDFRSGTLGPLAMYVLSRIIPSNSIQNLFFILNLLGILAILMYFRSKLTSNALLLCFIFAIWSAPYREIVTNGQITSLLYLLIFFSLLLLRRQNEGYRKLINLGTAALLSAIAIDLKPHICLPIIFFVGLAQRNIRYLGLVIVIIILSHALIDVQLGAITEIEWIQNLVGVQSTKEYSKWPEQYNIWPILDYAIPGYFFWKSISALCIVSVVALLVYLSVHKKEQSIWFVVASLSMVIPYSQLYSLTLLVVISMVHIVSTKLDNTAYLFLLFVLIPRYWTEPKNIIFIMVFLVIFSAFNVIEEKISILKNIGFVLTGTLLNILVHVLNDSLELNEDLRRSLICVEVTIFSLILLVGNKKIRGKLRNRRMK